MSRLVEPGVIIPPRGMAERMAAHRLGLGDPRGAPRHFRPGIGFWDAGGVVVPTDGPSNWYRPTSAAHFTALAMNTPDVLLLCQDTSGAAVPTIDTPGAGNWTTQGTGHLYEQTVTGWTSKFLGLDGTVQQRWGTLSSALDLSAGESYAIIVYLSFTIPSVDTGRLVIVHGTNNALIPLSTTGRPRIRWNAVSGTGTIDHSGLSTVHMYGLFRRADTDVSGLVTDLESISVTHDETAKTGEIKGIGTSNTSGVESRYNWVAIWKGTNAEFSMSSYITTLKH